MTFPITLCFMVRQNGLTFFTPSGQICLDGNSDALSKILSRCDGHTHIDEIVAHANTLGLESSSVLAALNELEALGIVADSATASLQAVRFWNNPSLWFQPTSEEEINGLLAQRAKQCVAEGGVFSISLDDDVLFGLPQRRKSHRAFGNRPLTARELNCVVAASYGTMHRAIATDGGPLPTRTVGSAGAMYPLGLFVGIFQDGGSIPKGIYRLDEKATSLVYLNANADSLYSTFGLDYIEGMPYLGLIFVCRPMLASQKYSNRAILFSILEAGHASQNAQLEATRLQLASLECGGLNETGCSQLLGLDWPREFPATTMLIGAMR